MTSKQTALPCISTKYLRYEVFSFSCALSRKWNESKFPERINMLKSRMIGEISHSPALNRRWRWERRLCGMCCYSQQGFAFTKPLFFQFTSFSKLITDLSIKKSVPSIKIKKKQQQQQNCANMHCTGTYFMKAITLHGTYNYCMWNILYWWCLWIPI